MKRILLWVIVIGSVAILYLLYQSNRSTNRLNIDPHAAREIEKAKRR